jgi:hypothetical protein
VTTLVPARNAAADADRPTVFVHIENYARVPPEVVRAAQDQLAHVYDAAGVTVESSAEPGHSRCAPRLTVHVMLLTGSRADRYIKDAHVARRVVAQASSEARRVYVLWDRLGGPADHPAVARGDALGLVMAHELGHVLLPARRHSKNGIMQQHYDVRLSYRLKFSVEESAAMRAFITGASSRGDSADWQVIPRALHLAYGNPAGVLHGHYLCSARHGRAGVVCVARPGTDDVVASGSQFLTGHLGIGHRPQWAYRIRRGTARNHHRPDVDASGHPARQGRPPRSP